MFDEVPAAARRHQLQGKSEGTPVRARNPLPRWLILGGAATVAVLGVLVWKQAATKSIPVQARSEQPAPQVVLSAPQASTTESPTIEAPTPMATLPEKLATLSRLQSALADAPPDQQHTGAQLSAFARDGDLRRLEAISPEQVEALAATLLSGAVGEELSRMLEDGLHTPPGYLGNHPNPARAVADLFQAVRGDGDPSVTRSLVFTDHCEESGAATGNVHVIPAGTHRIYAAFENAGGLHGLQDVFAVWRDPADAKMVFAQYERVRSGTAFNYVWLDLDEGWPVGHYELALYHPQRTTELLASRSFNVR